MYMCVYVYQTANTHTYMKLKHMFRRSHFGFRALADMGKNASVIIQVWFVSTTPKQKLAIFIPCHAAS